jgi:hypothetical protein
MFTKLSNWFLKISTWPLTLACLILFLVFSTLFLPIHNATAAVYAGELGTPDTSFYYTSAKLYQMADGYGSLGRAAYIRARFAFDIIWPLVYLAFLVMGISWMAKRSKINLRICGRLNLLPIIGVIFDFLENGSAVVVMARYPKTTPVFDVLSGIFTTLKWIFMAASVIILFFLAIFTLIKFIHSRQQPR